MSHSHPILPTKPISLPYSHFFTSPIAPYAPTLRAKVIPHLLIQSPPMASSVIARRLEGCTEVVMPVGGKVPITLTVYKEVLEDIGVGEGIEISIMNQFINSFSLNHSVLGLLPLEPVIEPPATSVATSRSTTLILDPLTACPTQNILFKNLIPSGSPIAFLTGIDVFYEWVVNRPNSPIKRNQRLQGDTGKEAEEEEEDLLLIDGAKEIENSISRHDAFELQGVQVVPSLSHQNETHDAWLQTQLESSIDRLFREQFIRRFPLIFDGGLLKYSSALHVPRGIPSALTQLLHLSNMYNTPLAKEMKTLLKPISQHQEQRLYTTVREASDLQARKGKRKSHSQSQAQNQIQEGSSSLSKKKRTSDPPTSLSFELDMESMDPSDRCHAYLQRVMLERREWEDEGGNKTEKKLKRIIGDLFGEIGRSSFEIKRRKAGKMSYSRVQYALSKLVHSAAEIAKENCLALTSQSHSNHQTPLFVADSHTDMDESGEDQDATDYSSDDELLIDQDSAYEPYDEDDELLLEIPVRQDELLDRDHENDDDDDLLLIEEDFERYLKEEDEMELLIDKDRVEEAELGVDEKKMKLPAGDAFMVDPNHFDKPQQNGRLASTQPDKFQMTNHLDISANDAIIGSTGGRYYDGQESGSVLPASKDKYDHLPGDCGELSGTVSFEIGGDAEESSDELLI
ncbi:hypothetical protein I204_03456 [Kwoniella mangroviensis CBS 8886]|nr:hypothetical protein I204_03456 [Kwoniella mangroviensis CBS 8886]